MPLTTAPLPEGYEYEDGDPILPGHVVETSPHYDLVLSGVLTLVVSYVEAVLGAAIAPSMNMGFGGGGGKIAEPAHVWPFYVPVVGPFIAFGTIEEGLGHAGAAASAAFETLGLVLIIGGLAAEEQELVPDEAGTSRLWLSPSAGMGYAGFCLEGALW